MSYTSDLKKQLAEIEESTILLEATIDIAGDPLWPAFVESLGGLKESFETKAKNLATHPGEDMLKYPAAMHHQMGYLAGALHVLKIITSSQETIRGKIDRNNARLAKIKESIEHYEKNTAPQGGSYGAW